MATIRLSTGDELLCERPSYEDLVATFEEAMRDREAFEIVMDNQALALNPDHILWIKRD